MPQTTYLPLFHATYGILAPAQKPGGVTVETALPPSAVPNPIPQPPSGTTEPPPTGGASSYYFLGF